MMTPEEARKKIEAGAARWRAKVAANPELAKLSLVLAERTAAERERVDACFKPINLSVVTPCGTDQQTAE